MLTSPPSSPAGRGCSGFTLLEIIVVMFILALVSGAVVYSTSGSLETARFRSMLARTSALLKEGRTSARREMEEKLFQVDVARRRLGYIDTGELIELPAGVELKAVVSAEEAGADGLPGIRFYPAGGSSGGTLTFTFKGISYEIRVNWLTANVSTSRI